MLFNTDILLEKILNLLSPKELGPTSISSTTTGTISTGASEIFFSNTGGANATITFSDASTYVLGTGKELRLPAILNRRWKNISYDATGTTLKILVIP